MESYLTLSHVCESVYSNIFKAIKKDDDQIVALKVIPMDRTGVSLDAVREVVILKNCRHPHIMNLIDQYIFDGNFILVFPFADCNLKEYNMNYHFNINHLFKQLVQAVHYCHQNFIIHRDIKPENILIIDEQVKLTDFGLATYWFNKEDKSKEVVTLWYRAPEILLNLPYNYKIDVWSLGCIYYELIYKEVLFKGHTSYDQLQLIYNKPCFEDEFLDRMLKLSESRIDSSHLLRLMM